MNGHVLSPVTRAQFRVKRFDAVLVINLVGLADMAALQQVRRTINEELASTRPTESVVVDLREAVILLTRKTFKRLKTRGTDVPAVPVALIVQPEVAALARRYCQAIEAEDDRYERASFTSDALGLELARAWARLPPQALAAPSETRRRLHDAPPSIAPAH